MDPPDRLTHVFAYPESCCETKFNFIAKEDCMGRAFVDTLETTTTSTLSAAGQFAALEENDDEASALTFTSTSDVTSDAPTPAPTLTREWYPAVDDEYECKSNTPPTWMTMPGYREAYIFESKEACCAVYRCT